SAAQGSSLGASLFRKWRIFRNDSQIIHHTLGGFPGTRRRLGRNQRLLSQGPAGQDAKPSPTRNSRSPRIPWTVRIRSGAEWEHFLARSKHICGLHRFRSSLSSVYVVSSFPIA